MFGGLAFLINGHLIASACHDSRLLITCSEVEYAEFLVEPGQGPMLRSGKPVSGWVVVDTAIVANNETLALRAGRGIAHSLSRPPRRCVEPVAGAGLWWRSLKGSGYGALIE